MQQRMARLTIGPRGPIICAALLGLSVSIAGWTAEPSAVQGAAERPLRHDVAESLAATSSTREPLNLLLTRAELLSVVRAYEERTGEDLTAPIDDDEILVTAPAERVPMRDASQDMWGGIAAPFWAIAHPKDAWRIFVPIPPKGQTKDEPPVPDPR